MSTDRDVILDQVVAAGTGFATELERGQWLRITDVEGQQVGDLVVFLAADSRERLSQGNTRKLNNTWLITTGHRLYSTRCRPLLTIVADDVGRHDLQSSACSPYDYPLRFGIIDHRSCLANLTEALAPYGIEEYLIPDPLNVFMHSQMAENGEITIHEPLSKPGDSIMFRADEDVIIGLSCCPQDQNACNAYRITDLRVTVLGGDGSS